MSVPHLVEVTGTRWVVSQPIRPYALARAEINEAAQVARRADAATPRVAVRAAPNRAGVVEIVRLGVVLIGDA